VQIGEDALRRIVVVQEKDEVAEADEQVRPLRRLGQALGQVRDLDVMAQKARRYAATLDQEQHDALQALLSHWRRRTKKARQMLILYLDGNEYRRFLRDFQQFLDQMAAQVPEDVVEARQLQVRYVLAGLTWRTYDQVRAFETILSEASATQLHALRIQCKALRYTLEFFQMTLGPEAPGLIADVIAVQDHLGDLQDASVADERLEDVLVIWAGKEKRAASAAGVQAYRAVRRQEVEALRAAFPAVWQRVQSPEFRRRLAETLIAL